MTPPRPRAVPAGKSSDYGVDVDRTAVPESPWRLARRRLTGRYPVDAFGGDPVLQDAVMPWLERLFTLEVDGGAGVPEIGPAALVTSRRPGHGDPLVVQAAVRDLRRRRARVLGYPDLPGVGGLARRLGAARARGDDLAALLRAGHVVVVPLSASLRRGRAGHAAAPVVWGAVGFPVLPVVVTGGAGAPTGVPLGHHRVVVGNPVEVDVVPRDPLGAAEVAEVAREAVQRLLDRETHRTASLPS